MASRHRAKLHETLPRMLSQEAGGLAIIWFKLFARLPAAQHSPVSALRLGGGIGEKGEHVDNMTPR